MDAAGDKNLPVPAGRGQGHEDGLGHGAAALVEAGIGDIEARQLADECLELEEHLQAALAGLGLVGRVSRVVFASAGDGIDNRGNEMIVAAAAKETDGLVRGLIASGQLLQVLGQFHFAEGRRYVQGPRQTQRRRDGLEQVGDGSGAMRSSMARWSAAVFKTYDKIDLLR